MIPPLLQETLAELTDNVRRLTEAVSLLAEAQARVYNTTLSPPGSRIPERREWGSFVVRYVRCVRRIKRAPNFPTGAIDEPVRLRRGALSRAGV